MSPLVLSLFPGIDMLGYAFKLEGFAVVQGGDVIFGGDIRDEHYPAGRFDGVIGGPPCQAFSPLANICRARGIAVKPNLIPEFQRVISEAQPVWFVMENVPRAPVPTVTGYATWSTVLNNRQLGEAQNRDRRWTFGDARTGHRTVLMIDTVAMQSIDYAPTVTANGTKWETRPNRKGRPKSYRSQKDFREYCRLQGLPEDFDLPPFRVDAKVAAVGNGVPLPMGRAIAKAVREAVYGDDP